MSGRTPRFPSYRLHKATGKAIVTIKGKMIYLGTHGSPESHQRYRQVILEHYGEPPEELSASLVGDPEITVADVLAAYWEHAEQYYVKGGRQTSEITAIRGAFRYVARLYADKRARDFSPLDLKRCREAMILNQLTRSTINGFVGRVKRAFRWATSEMLIPVTTFQALATVEGLKHGRSAAKETQPVLPVSNEVVSATLPHLSPQVRDMVCVQLLTGARPGEIVGMKVGDLDLSGEVWIYRVEEHKTVHRGRDRLVPIGPQAQEILRRHLKADPSVHVFDPRDELSHRSEQRRKARRTPLWHSHLEHQKRKRKQHPKRKPGERYSVGSYRNAVRRACIAAGIEVWTPHRLRHSTATAVRAKFGLEAAQVLLGHADPQVTTRYAERDLRAAVEVARQVG